MYAADSAIRNLIKQNQGAVERLANVEKIAFSESSLTNLSGACSTPRFDVRLIYEKKIDVAAERERLQKELDRYERKSRAANVNCRTNNFWLRLRNKSWMEFVNGPTNWKFCEQRRKLH